MKDVSGNKSITEWRMITCHRCLKTIDKENDIYGTRIVEDNGKKFRLWRMCIIMGDFHNERQ